MFCPSKLIRTCSVPLIHYPPPQSAMGARYSRNHRSKMQSTHREHPNQNSKHRRLRSVVRRHTPRSIPIPRRSLIRQLRILIAATQPPGVSAVAVAGLETAREVIERIGGAHITPHGALVLDEYGAVSERGAAGLHARVSLGWSVSFVHSWCFLVVDEDTRSVADTSLRRRRRAPCSRCSCCRGRRSCRWRGVRWTLSWRVWEGLRITLVGGVVIHFRVGFQLYLYMQDTDSYSPSRGSVSSYFFKPGMVVMLVSCLA